MFEFIFYVGMLGGVLLVLSVREIGHLMAARWCGVRVLRLSVGLGSEVFGLTDRLGTRWTLAAIPFGGYIKICDSRRAAADTAKHGLSDIALNQRAAIFAAGPVANLLLAGSIYGSLFVVFGEGALRGIGSANPAIVVGTLLSGCSIGVGLYNLIPIPPFDGGYLVLIGIETLTRKPIPQRIEKMLCTAGLATIGATTIAFIFFVVNRFIAANSF
jgi:membrane-associated protease RseP (regulator of RpoE activity)